VTDLDELGRHLAGLQDRSLADLAKDVSPPSRGVGEYLLIRARERRNRRRIARVSLLAVLLVGGAAIGVRTWSGGRSSTMARVRAEAGQRIAASMLDLAVDFADGSRVVLASGASMRTDAVGPASANLELERGHASIRVKHTATTRWTVRAGSYSVAVTGTRFSIDWHPERGGFSLAVEEGSVRVSGGLLSQPVDVGEGQSVAFEQGAVHELAAAGGPKGAASQPVAALPAPASDVRSAPPGTWPTPLDLGPAGIRRKPPGQHSVVPSWLEQAQAGHYRDALEEAERKGFDGICQQSSASDLLSLAEAARYAGRPARAEEALKATRDRFSRSDDAAVAAYLLGRIAAENRRDPAAAARWFRTYLDERPRGVLNREAEGRLLESLAFTDRESARAAARSYLQRYPTGPHAAFARNLLGP